MRIRRFLLRYRAAFLALAISALVHAAVFVSIPNRSDANPGDEAAPASTYSATLEGDAVPAAAAPKPAPRAAPKRVARARPAFHPVAVPEEIAPIAADSILPQMDVPVIEPVAASPAQDGAQSPPEKIALAQPAVPVPALAPPQFDSEALPPRLSIEYKLTSAFADGQAKYSWRRDGDSYTVNGEAEAIGFFALEASHSARAAARSRLARWSTTRRVKSRT